MSTGTGKMTVLFFRSDPGQRLQEAKLERPRPPAMVSAARGAVALPGTRPAWMILALFTLGLGLAGLRAASAAVARRP